MLFWYLASAGGAPSFWLFCKFDMRENKRIRENLKENESNAQCKLKNEKTALDTGKEHRYNKHCRFVCAPDRQGAQKES